MSDKEHRYQGLGFHFIPQFVNTREKREAREATTPPATPAPEPEHHYAAGIRKEPLPARAQGGWLADVMADSSDTMQEHRANLDMADQQHAEEEAAVASEYRAKYPGAPPPNEADYGAMSKDGYDLGSAPYAVPDMYQRPQPVSAQDIIDRARMIEEQPLLDLPDPHDVGAWGQVSNMTAAVGEGIRNASQEYLRMADEIQQVTGPIGIDASGPTTMTDPNELYLWSRAREAQPPVLPEMPGYTPGVNKFADDIMVPMSQFIAGYTMGPARLLKGATGLPELGEQFMRSAVATSMSFNPDEGNIGAGVRDTIRESERVRGVLESIGITDEDLKLLDSREGETEFQQRLKLAVEDGLLGLGFIGGVTGLKYLAHTKPAQQVADGLMDVIHSIQGSGDGRAINILQVGSVPAAKVSTRVPQPLSDKQKTAGLVREDAQADRTMRTGLDVMARDEKSFKRNVDLFDDYPGFEHDPNLPTGDKAKEIIRRMADNLLSIHDEMPDALRKSAAKWYTGVNKLAKGMAKKHKLTEEQAAGVIASLSPQKDWFMNLDLAQRTMEIHEIAEKRGWKPTPAMKKWFAEWAAAKEAPELATAMNHPAKTPLEKAYFTRAYDETMNTRGYNLVSPEGDVIGPALTQSGEPAISSWQNFDAVSKAISIIEDGALDNISENLGRNHKVRNFYNNIIDPLDPTSVTVDTHAVSAAQKRKLTSKSIEVGHNFGTGKGASKTDVTGTRGTYGLYHEAYTLAAKERGILPNQMQSITWEAVRGVLENLLEKVKHATERVKDPVSDATDKLKDNVETRAYLDFLEKTFDPADGVEHAGYEILDTIDESARKAGIEPPPPEGTIAYLATLAAAGGLS